MNKLSNVAVVPSSYFTVRVDLVQVGLAVAAAKTMLNVDELVYAATLACPSTIGHFFLFIIFLKSFFICCSLFF